MTVFAEYSRYYDLLYREKDYAAESRYVAALLERYASAAARVLEVGCGTGNHAVELARAGYDMTGVDMSGGMLAAAVARRESEPRDIAGRLRFVEGDARTVRLGEKFDAVISLFHVMSYQLTNDDLAAAFATAREHLDPGGAFIFDCWYGPAVLTQRPAVTVKHLADEVIEVERTATPVMHANRNIVDVNYTVVMTQPGTGRRETLEETHSMRYLFVPEVEVMLRAAGIELRASHAWMSDADPGVATWAACFIGTALPADR